MKYKLGLGMWGLVQVFMIEILNFKFVVTHATILIGGSELLMSSEDGFRGARHVAVELVTLHI